MSFSDEHSNSQSWMQCEDDSLMKISHRCQVFLAFLIWAPPVALYGKGLTLTGRQQAGRRSRAGGSVDWHIAGRPGLYRVLQWNIQVVWRLCVSARDLGPVPNRTLAIDAAQSITWSKPVLPKQSGLGNIVILYQVTCAAFDWYLLMQWWVGSLCNVIVIVWRDRYTIEVMCFAFLLKYV